MPKVHLVPEHVHVQDLPDVLLAIVSIHVRVCSELLANVRHFLLDAFGFLLLARAVAEIRYKDGEAAEVAPAHSWSSIGNEGAMTAMTARREGEKEEGRLTTRWGRRGGRREEGVGLRCEEGGAAAGDCLCARLLWPVGFLLPVLLVSS